MVVIRGSSLDNGFVLFVWLLFKNSNFKKNLVKSWCTKNLRVFKACKTRTVNAKHGVPKVRIKLWNKIQKSGNRNEKKWGSEVYLLTICSFAKKSEESTQQFIENLSIITRVACKASVSPKNDEKMCFLAQTSVYCLAETKVTLNK